MRWPWQAHQPSKATVEAEERLHAIEADDVKVADLERRMKRIIRENDLAPTIMRALGAS